MPSLVGAAYIFIHLLVTSGCLCVCRSGTVEKHVTEPAKRNKFLSDLQQLDSGEMQVKVSQWPAVRGPDL